jgi:hypothetical protein
MKNSELKGSANFLLFCFVFFVSICLFFEQPTIASETIEFKLAWDANTEADLEGYEIYFRDVVSGSVYQKIGDVTECRVDEIIGCGGARRSGIWYWDAAESEWAQMTSETTTGDIAAGDFTGDGKADVASVWSDGLWYQDGASLAWTKIDSLPPYNLTAGDVTGD